MEEPCINRKRCDGTMSRKPELEIDPVKEAYVCAKCGAKRSLMRSLTKADLLKPVNVSYEGRVG